ncbi:hypothetical protein VNO77_02446 [Canavalia gladiata]|uniref:Secreted protein n=1 Tax=Canavalia gladiata TaxID=3824 RepID=A0AAN9R5Y5_CANGL
MCIVPFFLILADCGAQEPINGFIIQHAMLHGPLATNRVFGALDEACDDVPKYVKDSCRGCTRTRLRWHPDLMNIA